MMAITKAMVLRALETWTVERNGRAAKHCYYLLLERNRAAISEDGWGYLNQQLRRDVLCWAIQHLPSPFHCDDIRLITMAVPVCLLEKKRRAI